MSNYFCINKSGVSIPVYSDTQKTSIIGSILNREAYGYDHNWGGDDYFYRIKFRKSNGALSYGFIIDPPGNSVTECTQYPYNKESIDGTQYHTFIMRNSRTVYTAYGSSWGTVAANRRVACLSALAGDDNPDWKGINYVENTKGVWVPVITDENHKYGYVDTGLSIASGYSAIPFYGSW